MTAKYATETRRDDDEVGEAVQQRITKKRRIMVLCLRECIYLCVCVKTECGEIVAYIFFLYKKSYFCVLAATLNVKTKRWRVALRVELRVCVT